MDVVHLGSFDVVIDRRRQGRDHQLNVQKVNAQLLRIARCLPLFGWVVDGERKSGARYMELVDHHCFLVGGTEMRNNG